MLWLLGGLSGEENGTGKMRKGGIIICQDVAGLKKATMPGAGGSSLGMTNGKMIGIGILMIICQGACLKKAEEHKEREAPAPDTIEHPRGTQELVDTRAGRNVRLDPHPQGLIVFLPLQRMGLQGRILNPAICLLRACLKKAH